MRSQIFLDISLIFGSKRIPSLSPYSTCLRGVNPSTSLEGEGTTLSDERLQEHCKVIACHDQIWLEDYVLKMLDDDEDMRCLIDGAVQEANSLLERAAKEASSTKTIAGEAVTSASTSPDYSDSSVDVITKQDRELLPTSSHTDELSLQAGYRETEQESQPNAVVDTIQISTIHVQDEIESPLDLPQNPPELLATESRDIQAKEESDQSEYRDASSSSQSPDVNTNVRHVSFQETDEILMKERDVDEKDENAIKAKESDTVSPAPSEEAQTDKAVEMTKSDQAQFSMQNVDSVPPSSTLEGNGEEDEGFERKTNLSSWQSEEAHENTPTSTTKGTIVEVVSSGDNTTDSLTAPSSSKDMVIFLDSDTKQRRRVPLYKLTSLGYSNEDIISLDPDALALIVDEQFPVPRTGIPSRWQSKDSGVRIVSEESATKETMSSQTGTKKRPSSTQEGDAWEGDKPLKKPGSTDKAEKPSFVPRSQRKKGPPTVEGRRRPDRDARDPRRSRNEKRRIYSGRPDKPVPRSDPPAPQKFWPDISTFRSLLRDEASMRIKILGEDWSQTVKDESNWRLELYKNWLWTLHNGVGDPFVESRSDRMRRMDREDRRNAGRNEKPRKKRSRD